MVPSAELYFLFNFAVDAALISIVARANDCLIPRRVLLGSLIASIYALLAALVPALGHPLVQLTLVIPVALILCESGDILRWGSIAFQLFCGAALLGGIAMLFAQRWPDFAWLATPLGLPVLHLLFSIRRKRLLSWEVSVYLSFQGRSIQFRALIDTGNRLREPISGLPVLIAESSLLQELLPRRESAGHFRQVAFGGLGGSGTVPCFHPDRVWICRNNQLIPAPEIWVAVYPGRIPGMLRALAPPSFAVIPGKR